ncbi:Pentatricopeptide repeat-containing protein [Spatholobus suberectus]|nr:Pentatricopeptide repeat-containing protein [Spatholobus suberectus]
MRMPINLDAVIWRSLLGACKIHGDVVMGEKVGKFLIQLEERSCAELAPKSEDYVALCKRKGETAMVSSRHFKALYKL